MAKTAEHVERVKELLDELRKELDILDEAGYGGGDELDGRDRATFTARRFRRWDIKGTSWLLRRRTKGMRGHMSLDIEIKDAPIGDPAYPYCRRPAR